MRIQEGEERARTAEATSGEKARRGKQQRDREKLLSERKEAEEAATHLAEQMKKGFGPEKFSNFRRQLEKVDLFHFLEVVQSLDSETKIEGASED